MTKILIIENEPMVSRMYGKIFEFEKFEVISAIGGKEGLEKVGSEKPDIILLDIMMPEPNGIRVLEELKANPMTNNIPVVMITNLSGKNDSELALSKGATDYWVKKEINPQDLGQKIREILKTGKDIIPENYPNGLVDMPLTE